MQRPVTPAAGGATPTPMGPVTGTRPATGSSPLTVDSSFKGGSIFIKQVVLYLLLILGVLGVTGRLFFSTARGHLEQEVGRRLEYVARIAARYTPVERLQLIRPDDDEARMVLRLEQKLGEILEATGVHRLFVFRPDRTALLDIDPAVTIGSALAIPQLSAADIETLRQDVSVHTVGYTTAGGELRMSAFAPIADEAGQLYAIVGVEGSTRELVIVEQMRNRLYWIAAGCALAALLVALLVARSITGPIRQIAAIAGRLGGGDYAARTTVLSHDEVGHLAQSINRMAEQISDRDAALKEMAASVAHEIRNPLNSIQLLLAVLAEDITAGRTQDHDETIRTLRYEVSKLNRFVDEFLTYSRPMTLIQDDVEVALIVNAVLDMAAGEASLRSVEIAHDVPPDLPVLRADRQRLEQSLLNLVINAVQAAGTGGRVDVRVESSNGGIDIVVEDSGPGISAEHMTNLFRPFFTTRADGTGLGLANASKIATEHGGRITATHNEDGGARFTLHLPTTAGLETT